MLMACSNFVFSRSRINRSSRSADSAASASWSSFCARSRASISSRRPLSSRSFSASRSARRFSWFSVVSANSVSSARCCCSLFKRSRFSRSCRRIRDRSADACLVCASRWASRFSLCVRAERSKARALAASPCRKCTAAINSHSKASSFSLSACCATRMADPAWANAADASPSYNITRAAVRNTMASPAPSRAFRVMLKASASWRFAKSDSPRSAAATALFTKVLRRRVGASSSRMMAR